MNADVRLKGRLNCTAFQLSTLILSLRERENGWLDMKPEGLFSPVLGGRLEIKKLRINAVQNCPQFHPLQTPFFLNIYDPTSKKKNSSSPLSLYFSLIKSLAPLSFLQSKKNFFCPYSLSLSLSNNTCLCVNIKRPKISLVL